MKTDFFLSFFFLNDLIYLKEREHKQAEHQAEREKEKQGPTAPRAQLGLDPRTLGSCLGKAGAQPAEPPRSP